MLGHRLDLAAEAREQPLAGALGVGHRLQRREGLRRDDEERFRRVQVAGGLDEIGPVDVRHEPEGHRAIAVVLEGLVGHDGPEVGAADADVDDVADALSGVALPRATPHAGREVGHGIEHGVDLGHHVLTIDDDRRTARSSQGHVQDGPSFRHVDLVAPEHGVDALAQTALLGQSAKQCEGIVGDAILGVVEKDPDRLGGQAFSTFGVVGEERAQVKIADLLVVGLEGLPCGARGQGQHSSH